ncbi:uncharacterized protein [Argopecten irradians]|uniref:uncharacterized protein n=1 Tax=Argopecten irradians TaxID=31199 RepID=UPI0037122A2E
MDSPLTFSPCGIPLPLTFAPFRTPSPIAFTPCRSLDFNDDEVESEMTPEVKKGFRQLFNGEDSGFGTDDENLSPEYDELLELSPLNFNTLLNPDSSSNIMTRREKGNSFTRQLISGKRPRDEEDDSPIPSSKSQRKGEAVFTKSLTFGVS